MIFRLPLIRGLHDRTGCKRQPSLWFLWHGVWSTGGMGIDVNDTRNVRIASYSYSQFAFKSTP